MEEQEKIELYLKNALSLDEHNAFERELEDNPALAEKVAFNRGLMGFFDDYEPELENMLASLGAEHFSSNVPPPDATPPSQKEHNRFNLLWLLPIILLIGGGLYWYSINDVTPTTSEETSTITTPTQESASEVVQETLPEETAPEGEPTQNTTNNPPAVKDIIVDDEPTSDISEQPIARIDPADFEVNPILETLLTEQVRATDYRSSIESPTIGQILQFNKTIPLHIKGQTTAPPPYELLIYSNRNNDFDNDYRTLTAELNSKKAGEQYPIKFNANIPMERGLYYWILRTKDEDILYVSKFTVE